MSQALHRLLQQRPYLLADGATGTNLFDMGLETGEAPELWNLDRPARIGEHHARFIDAGADIVLTNSFGGTRYRLKLHGAERRVLEINRSAAALAVAAVGEHPVVVAGSMGPTGEILAPLGTLSAADASAAFAEQAQGLTEGGADVLWIETMSSREELQAALAGAATTGLPTVCTLSFDTNGRTMMGVTPAEALQVAGAATPRPLACGANCGVGAADLVAALVRMTPRDAAVAIVAKANCGIPRFVDGAIVYDGTPQLMADYARLARDAGARIIGGCCGTTPAHIAAMREALHDYSPQAAPSLADIETRLGPVSRGAAQQLRGEAPAAPTRRTRRRRR